MTLRAALMRATSMILALTKRAHEHALRLSDTELECIARDLDSKSIPAVSVMHDVPQAAATVIKLARVIAASGSPPLRLYRTLSDADKRDICEARERGHTHAILKRRFTISRYTLARVLKERNVK